MFLHENAIWNYAHLFHCIYAKSCILLQFLYKTGPARVPLQGVMGPRNPRKSHLHSSVTSLSIQIAFKAAQMVPNGAKLSPQNPQNASKTMENGWTKYITNLILNLVARARKQTKTAWNGYLRESKLKHGELPERIMLQSVPRHTWWKYALRRLTQRNLVMLNLRNDSQEGAFL